MTPGRGIELGTHWWKANPAFPSALHLGFSFSECFKGALLLVGCYSQVAVVESFTFWLNRFVVIFELETAVTLTLS